MQSPSVVCWPNRRWLKLLSACLLTIGLAGCQIDSDPKSELENIKERGVLRVGTLNNQLSYYIGPDGPTGLDYELARQFADALGVKLEMKPAFRQASLFPALQKGEIDIIAAGLSQSPERIQKFRAGPAYYYVSQQVVYKKGHWRPRNLEQLLNTQQELIDKADGEEVFAIPHYGRLAKLLVFGSWSMSLLLFSIALGSLFFSKREKLRQKLCFLFASLPICFGLLVTGLAPFRLQIALELAESQNW